MESLINTISVSHLLHRSYAEIFVCIALLLGAYTIGLASYRITLHPLASFPGPAIAAITKWYEFYYDVLKDGGGRYTFKIKELHEKYGAVVRINPNELHVDDPEWYDVLYAGRGERRDKYAPAAGMAGTPLGIFGTSDHHLHRARRGAISQLFSKRAVNAKSGVISKKIDLLCEQLQDEAKADGVVELRAKFLAFATDVVCEYGLGASPHPELLPNPKAQANWQETIYALEDLTPLVKQFYQALPIAFIFPSWVFRPVSSNLSRLKALHEGMYAVASKFVMSMKDHNYDVSRRPKGQIAQNIFEEIWQSDLTKAEKRVDRLAQEGLVLIAAGGETVSRVLCVATYHLLANEQFGKTLQLELDAAFVSAEDKLTLMDLERLPFLSAVVKESLRVAAVISSRLPLVCPDKPLTYRDWIIPRGTPVSMTLAHVLSDPRCFDSPAVFNPERWLRTDAEQLRADKYFLAFSKGSRMCLGINLAYAELFMVLGTLFRQYDMELFDTFCQRDVDHSHDCFVGKPMKTSRGVKIKLNARE